MSFKLSLTLAPAVILVAGCADPQIGMRDAALGEAVKYNSAIQTINPDPVYPEGSAQPGENGEHAAKAVERYRKGQVTPVVQVQTTSGSSSSGSSSSGMTSGPP